MKKEKCGNHWWFYTSDDVVVWAPTSVPVVCRRAIPLSSNTNDFENYSKIMYMEYSQITYLGLSDENNVKGDIWNRTYSVVIEKSAMVLK